LSQIQNTHSTWNGKGHQKISTGTTLEHLCIIKTNLSKEELRQQVPESHLKTAKD
jgi:hypothetical protein